MTLLIILLLFIGFEASAKFNGGVLLKKLMTFALALGGVRQILLYRSSEIIGGFIVGREEGMREGWLGLTYRRYLLVS